jgi:hypothetical protein
MDKAEINKRIAEEEDYIRCPKVGNSLSKFLSKNTDGVEDTTIARLMNMTPEEVEKIYQEAVERLRNGLNDES